MPGIAQPILLHFALSSASMALLAARLAQAHGRGAAGDRL